MPRLLGTLAIREHFVARPSDIFVATFPKSGTTWLKCLVFSVVHRGHHPPRNEGHPLRHANPHDVVHLLDDLYLLRKNPDLSLLPSPRIFGTHNPYSVQPGSIKNSGCRFIYLTREPKDNFVSLWHFRQAMRRQRGIDLSHSVSMDDVFDMFCSGISINGPIWEHALQYWNEHLRHPDKVLFLKYETMMEDPMESLKRLAVFLGCPFSADEEKQGVLEDISELCSFKGLSNLEVNKDGALRVAHRPDFGNKLFFRRGEVGDWANHLTPEMAERLDRITHEKLRGSGLNF